MQLLLEDVLRFAAWSADRNPLHVDADFARQTHFGQQVVHGVLTVLEALRGTALARPATTLDVEFRGAVLIGGSYAVESQTTGDETVVTVTGDGQVVLVIRAGHRAVASPPRADGVWLALAAERAPRETPAVHTLDRLREGVRTEGRYPPSTATSGLPVDGLAPMHVRALALCSYLIGMEMPGLKSLFTRISLTFHDDAGGDDDDLLYRARSTRFDTNFRLLDTELEVVTGTGRAVASGTLRSYVPFSPAEPALEELKAQVGASATALEGKVALVLGASRGLGADIAAALAYAGCHVYLNSRRDDERRRHVHERLSSDGCHVEFLQGDCGDAAWCASATETILARHGRLDAVVLNACAPPTSVRLGTEGLIQHARYVEENLRLVATPVAVCLDALDKSGGALVYISSSAVDAPPVGWSHYVAVKQSGEAIVRTAALERGRLCSLIARPPALQTTWSDTPTRAAGSIPTSWAAVRIVTRLPEAWRAGNVDLLTSFPALETAAPAERAVAPAELSIRLAASFTTDPMLAALRFWVRELDLDASVDVAPYGQVLQSLLDPSSALNSKRRGLNLVLLRVRDWLHELPDERIVDMSFLQQYLQQTAADFVAAMRSHRGQATAETILVVCPSYGSLSAAEGILLRQTEAEVLSALAGVPGVLTVTAADYHARYGVNEDEAHDPLRDEIAHIPYRDEYLAVLSTVAARVAHARLRPVRKVVVVDCDNTLWRGVVGEAGAEGVEFDAAHQALHRTLERLTESGLLVCLCSKNEEPDVWQVFDSRPELLLRRDRVVAAMINWLPKSQNLRTLAGRLNLGLDSFVFIDDNPVECAEVRAGCPEVLTIQWPHDDERALRLLEHIWEFDATKTTREDARRTELYKEEFRRQEARSETLTFDDFIKNLGLVVDFSPLAPEDVRRAAQLTLRTNQFNFTTIRREEADIQALASGGRHEIRTVRVRDRFGDYGLVGLVIAERGAEAWSLDTFLLSCRVLGRGVEHQILADLGTMARESGATAVTLRVETTKRNTPARSFLESVVANERRRGDERGVACEVPADELAAVTFNPAVTGEVIVQDEGGSKPSTDRPFEPSRLRRREEQIARAAFELATGRDVRALVEGKPSNAAPALSRQDIATAVHEVFAAALRIDAAHVAAVDGLEALGCDSLRIVEITVALSEKFPSLPSTLLFEHRSVSQIVKAIGELGGGAATEAPAGALRARTEPRNGRASSDIAVVGMHLRCAGADSPDELWSLLSAGRSAVKPVPADRPRFLHRLVDERPHWAGLVDDVAGFDAEFFGVSPREAEIMDPQLRLFLEVAWRALEDAGAVGARQPDPSTGVYAGVMYGDYGFRANRGAGAGLYRCWEGFSLANRLSQLLGFNGPSVAVDTACSSSATALHLACQALRAGECHVALVGGVNLILDPDRFGSLGRLGILSTSGKCEPFGADADGTVLGEGVGVVVLRPLEEALRRGDRIHGVIKGTGLSTGSGTVGFTAPNPQAQSEAGRRALTVAGIDPRTISYVETHGTGTVLGDPIEVRGLTLAYGAAEVQDPAVRIEHHCTIGSIKPNIGHLEAGAAVMGLIKVLLQMRHGMLVPSITSQTPNPHIPFGQGPFEVQRRLSEWTRPTAVVDGSVVTLPRRAGLNSFGVGGANAHIVVEEAPAAVGHARTPADRDGHVLTLSAPSAGALARQVESFVAHLGRHEPVSLADLCFTVNTGRRHFDHRVAMAAQSVDELRTALASWAGPRAGSASPAPPKVAFLFTGQGAQYAGMGRRLYETQPVFRDALDRCATVFDAMLGRRLLGLLFAEEGSESGELLNQTGFTQPALFAFEYALAQLWLSWGVKPDVVMGHSVGEIAAMCVAGGVSLDDGLKLIAARGRLMQQLPPGGAMTSVMADEARVLEAIAGASESVAIAAVNAPGQVVISGAGTSVAEITARLTADGIKTKALLVSHAFHSPLMKPMLAEYARVVREIRFSPPSVPFVSCVDGGFVTREVTDPEYWLRQVMDPVRFAAGTQVLDGHGVSAYVEIGPHPVLLGMARRGVADDTHAAWLPSLRKDHDEWRTMLGSVASLYERGADIDWAQFDAPYQRVHIPVPAYAFSHKRHWLKHVPAVEAAPTSGDAALSAHAAQRYEVQWQTLGTITNEAAYEGAWLVLADRGGIGEALAERLRRPGREVTVAFSGDRYTFDGKTYVVNPLIPGELQRLWAAVTASGTTPRVVHLWSLDAPAASQGADAMQAAVEREVLGLALLARTLGAAGVSRPSLWLVTGGAIAGDTDRELAVAQAPVWGFGRTVALEYPELWGGLVDISYPRLADAVPALALQLTAGDEDQVALAPSGRRAARLVAGAWQSGSAVQMKTDATYLVTGGAGAIGLRISRWLVTNGARNVVLVSRRAEPDQRVKDAVGELERMGASVALVSCDVTRGEDVDNVLAFIGRSGRPLRGIVHAAGVDETRPIAALTPERIGAVLASKVKGAWLLHERTRHLPLDLFVMCSSMASILGAQGRAHYAAANAFLDALAGERRRIGLAATAINWGPWQGGGMAGADQLEQFERIGNRGLAPDAALWALGQVVNDGPAHVGVADIDWDRFQPIFESRRKHRLLAGLTPAPRTNEAVASQSAPWVGRLAAVDSDRKAALAQLLRGEIAETMGFDNVESVPQDRDFFELGMDSLMMAELVGRLKKQCGVSVSDLVFDHPSVKALASHLIERIPIAAAADSAAPSSAPAPPAAAGPLDGMSGYRPEDEAEIFAFQQVGWPHRSVELIPGRWRWLFAESAARLRVKPQAWLYRDEGSLVGHMAAIPVRLKIGDNVHDTAWLADTMVLEPYRKKAVGSRLMVQAHEDLPFALSLGQTAEMREIQYRLGWKNVAPLQTAQLMIRPENVLQGKVPKPAAVAAGWGRRAASAVRDLMRTERVSVREIDRFCERHDGLWQQMAESVACAVVRDASYMNWKYVEQPGQEFVRLEVLDGESLVGAAILTFREANQAYAYRRALLVDLLVPLTNKRALAQVLQAAASAAGARGADALWCLHTGAQLSKALRLAGFVFRKPKRFLLIDPGINGAAREEVLSPDSWFLTQGDSDVDRPW